MDIKPVYYIQNILVYLQICIDYLYVYDIDICKYIYLYTYQFSFLATAP